MGNSFTNGDLGVGLGDKWKRYLAVYTIIGDSKVSAQRVCICGDWILAIWILKSDRLLDVMINSINRGPYAGSESEPRCPLHHPITLKCRDAITRSLVVNNRISIDLILLHNMLGLLRVAAMLTVKNDFAEKRCCQFTPVVFRHPE